MNTKEEIEKQLLIAMNAMDEMQSFVHKIPEEEGYQDCFMSNLIDMKSKLKHFLNNDFDRLARQSKEIFISSFAKKNESKPFPVVTANVVAAKWWERLTPLKKELFESKYGKIDDEKINEIYKTHTV